MKLTANEARIVRGIVGGLGLLECLENDLNYPVLYDLYEDIYDDVIAEQPTEITCMQRNALREVFTDVPHFHKYAFECSYNNGEDRRTTLDLITTQRIERLKEKVLDN